MGAALEYLLNDLFDISLSLENGNKKDAWHMENILESREEEKMALEAIYEDSFKERIPNKIWNLDFQLPVLNEILAKKEQCKEGKRAKPEEKKRNKKPCPFYLKGSCRFKEKCKFSHAVQDSRGTDGKANDLSHPIYNNLKALTEEEDKNPFNLEIRFPEGNRYPEEPPLIAFSSTLSDLPSHTRLNITKFLMSLATELANDCQPCIYSLVSSLEDKDKLEELLNLPPPHLGKPISDSKYETVPRMEDIAGSPEKLFTRDNTINKDVNKKSQFKDSEICGSKDMSASGSSKKPTLRPEETGKRGMKKEVNIHEVRKQNRILQDDFRAKQSSNQYKKMMSQRQRLPAWDKRNLVTDIINRNQVVVISGMTGCGKTTQVPQFLLDEALSSKEFSVNIICTQPRRISAMAAAQRVADERCERLGKSVGYQIRLESVTSAQTRLLFCTTGIILRRLEGDPLLGGVTHIIIDEVHERSEESDFLLMILRDVLLDRPDLKIILMSATVNADLFSEYFEGCPMLEIPGRTFPVQQFFLEDVIENTDYRIEDKSPYARIKMFIPDEDLDWDDEYNGTLKLSAPEKPAKDKTLDMNLTHAQMKLRYPEYKDITLRTMSKMDMDKINYDLIVGLLEYIVTANHDFAHGAILVFLPGFAEIQTLYDNLLSTSEFGMRNKGRYKIIPLHSTLSSEDQNAVFQKPRDGVIKIVIATNIAETSITIDDVTFVVDAGKMKEKRYDQEKSMESLETVWVSRANAIQRRGRAGRVQKGVCFHLFTYHHYEHFLRAQPIPEIQRAPLEQLLLKIKILPVFSDQDVKEVLARLIEAPSQDAISGAVKRLQDLGAIDDCGDLTPLGYHLGALPVDVRIAKLMLFGAMFRCLDSSLTIAAAMSFKSPFVSPFGLKKESDEAKKEFAVQNSDYLTILNAYRGWIEARDRGSHQAYLYCQEKFLSVKSLQMLASLKKQYLVLLSDIGFIRSGIRMRDVDRAGRGGSDGVAEITGLEGNINSNNLKLLSGILVAALYPNIVQILTPDVRYHASSAGAVQRAPTSEELKFQTKDGFVHVHPSSVNYNVRNFQSPYLIYHEKVKTSKVFIRDCSMVTVYPLLLFGGANISIDMYQGDFILSVDDGWIKFLASSPQIAELLKELRKEMDQLLEDKISQPDMDLLTLPRGSKIINCISTLIAS